MVVGEMAEPCDLVVLGGGPGGYVAALRAARLGRRVVLVERGGTGALGGSCLHVGCIPSKALIELAEVRERAAAFAVAGLDAQGLGVDLERFQLWKDGITRGLAQGVKQLLHAAGVQVVEGDCRFSRRDRVAVQTPDGNVRFFEFRHAVIATGSRPVHLAAFPVDQRTVLDSSGALSLSSVPETAVVLGGGYIGLELGTALAKLGCRVTIVEALDRVLPSVDADLLSPVNRRLKELGVDVRTGTRALSFDGGSLTVEGASGTEQIAAEKLIVAVGRRPNTDDLGLQALGVEVDELGLIPVGPDMRATEHVAAIGDVVHGPALAHKAMREGAVAAEALSGSPSTMDVATIPRVVFSDPEVALAGLTKDEAASAGIEVDAARFPLSASGRAATLGVRSGFVQVLAERASRRVVGVQVVGPHASELIAEATLAVEMVATVDDLADTVHTHPTLSEALSEAAATLAGRPVHVH